MLQFDSPLDALVAEVQRLSRYEAEARMDSADFFARYIIGKSWRRDSQHRVGQRLPPLSCPARSAEAPGSEGADLSALDGGNQKRPASRSPSSFSVTSSNRRMRLAA
jgi:hypothetical protein